MQVSTFQSPAYGVTRVKIEDLVSQKVNPNSMTGKAWDALQQSIFNTGYTFPVICSNNEEYDPSTEGLPRPDLIENSDGEQTFTSSGKVGTQVSDDDIAKYFPYRLIDGSHRTQVVRLGTYWFRNGHDRSEQWVKGEDVPERPGVDMLAYLAWRENFTIPAVILNIDSTQQMSAEILHNTARGSHSLDSMKDIVYNLINIAGMSEEWVAQNLYLDMESVRRMQQLSGLKASMQDIDACDMGWSPDEDDSYGRKIMSFLTREATKWVEVFRQEHESDQAALDTIPRSGTAIEMALACGFGETSTWKKNQSAYEAAVRNMTKGNQAG